MVSIPGQEFRFGPAKNGNSRYTSPMKIIGLTGGIASGKSAVAAELAQLGAVVLDADQAAHEVINLPSVQQELVDRWGESVLDTNSKIVRSEVAQRVFSDSPQAATELQFLEETLHPRIRQQFEAELDRLRAAGQKVAVIDAPLLLEAGWQSLCDSLIFIDSPRAARLERAIQRNWTEAEFTKREACQMPIAEKRKLATQILENSGSLPDLRGQVLQIWNALVDQ